MEKRKRSDSDGNELQKRQKLSQMEMLESVVEKLERIETNFESKLNNLESKFESKFNHLESKLDANRTELRELNRKVGHLNDANLRRAVATMFGESYSKQYIIKGVLDLIKLLLKAVGKNFDLENIESVQELLLMKVETIIADIFTQLKATELLGTKVGKSKTKKLCMDASKVFASKEWEINVEQGNEIIKSILNTYQENDIAKRRKKLGSCQGCAIKILFLDAVKVYMSEIEFDLRGRITRLDANQLRYMIDIGECKSGKNTDAKVQLKRRLEFIRKMLDLVHKVDETNTVHYHLVGRIFAPAYGKHPITDEIKTDEISFYLHVL